MDSWDPRNVLERRTGLRDGSGFISRLPSLTAAVFGRQLSLTQFSDQCCLLKGALGARSPHPEHEFPAVCAGSSACCVFPPSPEPGSDESDLSLRARAWLLLALQVVDLRIPSFVVQK